MAVTNQESVLHSLVWEVLDVDISSFTLSVTTQFSKSHRPELLGRLLTFTL